MVNQIQLYHNATAVWLDKDWKTLRERKLEKEITELRKRLDLVEIRTNKALTVVRTLIGYGNLEFWCPQCRTRSRTKFNGKTYVCQNCKAEIF